MQCNCEMVGHQAAVFAAYVHAFVTVKFRAELLRIIKKPGEVILKIMEVDAIIKKII